MSFDEFKQQNNGKYIEKEDSANLNQCFDLAFAWVDYLGIPRDTIRHQLACQIYTNPLDITLQYFEIIPNTPNGVPQKGDLVVWAGVFNGGAGHVGIATGSGNSNIFEVFEQNDPLKSPSHLKTYAYASVLGWLRPRLLQPNYKTVLQAVKQKVDELTQLLQQAQL